METLGLFAVGFAAGWAVRSGVDSSRKLAVAAIAAAYEVSDRARRWVAVEREHLEDLLAEGRAMYEARARRPATGHRAGPRAAQPSHDTASRRPHAA
jgi:hypothetical protein